MSGWHTPEFPLSAEARLPVMLGEVGTGHVTAENLAAFVAEINGGGLEVEVVNETVTLSPASASKIYQASPETVFELVDFDFEEDDPPENFFCFIWVPGGSASISLTGRSDLYLNGIESGEMPLLAGHFYTVFWSRDEYAIRTSPQTYRTHPVVNTVQTWSQTEVNRANGTVVFCSGGSSPLTFESGVRGTFAIRNDSGGNLTLTMGAWNRVITNGTVVQVLLMGTQFATVPVTLGS